MATINSINAKLGNLDFSSGFDKLNQQANVSAANVQALNSSSLGTLLGENLSGVLSLTTNLDPKRGVGLLTENLTGLKDLVVNDVSSSKSDLDAMTGSSVNNGFNRLIVAATTAEGVKSAISKAAPTATDQQKQTIITNIVPLKFSNQVADITVKDFNQFSTEFTTASSAYTSAFSNIVKSATGNVLQDVILQTDATPLNLIENIGVSTPVAASVLVLLQSNNSPEAVKIVVAETGKPAEVVEAALAAIPVGISDQIEKRSVGKSSTAVYDVSSKNNEWNGSSTPPEYFDIIATLEQLKIEMIKCPREITEIVFFGHEMTQNQILTAKDIHESYNAEGSDGIPFHYVVLSGGNIQRGRPISKGGAYSSTREKFSIGIVVPHVKNNPATIKQGESAQFIMEAFYSVWPGGQVFDAHKDVDDLSEVEVGINIEGLRQSLRKDNHGQSSKASSTKQLISASQGNV
jgi:hypothetical protein